MLQIYQLSLQAIKSHTHSLEVFDPQNKLSSQLNVFDIAIITGKSETSINLDSEEHATKTNVRIKRNNNLTEKNQKKMKIIISQHLHTLIIPALD